MASAPALAASAVRHHASQVRSAAMPVRLVPPGSSSAGVTPVAGSGTVSVIGERCSHRRAPAAPRLRPPSAALLADAGLDVVDEAVPAGSRQRALLLLRFLAPEPLVARGVLVEA